MVVSREATRVQTLAIQIDISKNKQNAPATAMQDIAKLFIDGEHKYFGN